MQAFSFKEALLWGWQKFKRNPIPYIAIFLFLIAFNMLFTILTNEKTIGSGVFQGIGQIVVTAVQWWFYIGLIGILISVYDGARPSFEKLFSQSGGTLLNYILGTILYILIVLGGLILFIVPGVIWSIKFQYYAYAIVDKGMSPIDALKQSGVLTSGRKWTLFGFFLILGLLNFLGAILFGVGLLISLPVTLLALVWSYRWLETHSSATVSKELD